MNYRNRPEAYNLPASEWRTYFVTHQPSEWIGNTQAEAIFGAIYGNDVLQLTRLTVLVPENINQVWVGGPNWSGRVYDEKGVQQFAFAPPGAVAPVAPPLPWENRDDALTVALRIEKKIDQLLAR